MLNHIITNNLSPAWIILPRPTNLITWAAFLIIRHIESDPLIVPNGIERGSFWPCLLSYDNYLTYLPLCPRFAGWSSDGGGGKCSNFYLHMLCRGSSIDSWVGLWVLQSDVRDATPATPAPECQGRRSSERKSVWQPHRGNTCRLNNLSHDVNNSFAWFHNVPTKRKNSRGRSCGCDWKLLGLP